LRRCFAESPDPAAPGISFTGVQFISDDDSPEVELGMPGAVPGGDSAAVERLLSAEDWASGGKPLAGSRSGAAVIEGYRCVMGRW